MKKKLTNLQLAHKIARKKKGYCLTLKEQTKTPNYKWKCKEGHEWNASLKNIEGNRAKEGTWCPYCAGVKVQTSWIERLCKVAKDKKGQCLDSKCSNQNQKIKFKCSESHIWKARASHVYLGSWCPICAGTNRRCIEDYKKLAKEKGGYCLSNRYTNQSSILKFRCGNGHSWKTMAGTVKSGSWCPYCAGNSQLHIKDLIKTAKQRGGLCLSSEYESIHTKYEWKCVVGHEWKATYSSIKRGTWCPQCSEYIGEKITRIYFENVFKMNFNKVHPEWLRDKKGDPWEIDGLGEKKWGGLKIAFEHHGIQHYKEVGHFHQSGNTLKIQKRKDRLRRKRCAEKNIALFEIPQLLKLTAIEDLPAVIEKQFLQFDFIGPIPKFNMKIDYSSAYRNSQSDAIEEIVTTKGGKVIRKIIKGKKIYIEIQCKDGHKWELVPASLKIGTWCPYCHGNKKVGGPYSFYASFAKKLGGVCLSAEDEYQSARKNLRWECKEGHTWNACPDSIQRGSWCPKCRKKEVSDSQKDNIEDMRIIAKSKQGKCISTSYINSKTKLTWECSNGHRWDAIPSAIKRGTWCALCDSERKRIDAYLSYLKIAQEKNGTCLTPCKEYRSSRKQQLKWKCKEGHVWETSPSWIKLGGWCPICTKNK